MIRKGKSLQEMKRMQRIGTSSQDGYTNPMLERHKGTGEKYNNNNKKKKKKK